MKLLTIIAGKSPFEDNSSSSDVFRQLVDGVITVLQGQLKSSSCSKQHESPTQTIVGCVLETVVGIKE